jgi:protein-arginine kinase activator protein McsA
MPILAFHCDSCDNEFEKIVSNKQQLFKWCNHCQLVTPWETDIDQNSQFYKEEICSACLGNKYKVPVRRNARPNNQESVHQDCPSCGKEARHILRVERRGNTSTGPSVANSSVRFQFNYTVED